MRGATGIRSGMVLVALMALAAALAGLATPGAAQDFEPFARAPGVRVPVERMALSPTSPLPRRPLAAPFAPGLEGLRLEAATAREFPLLVIPALFQDSPEPAVTPEVVDSVVFSPVGRTLTTYYLDMSAGALEVTGEVPDWVRTHVTRLDGAGNVDGHGYIGDGAGEHFQAAVDLVDPAIDFTLFDNDGPDGVPDSGDDDGFVDAVAFKFTEVAGSCGGPGFWPHRYVLFDAQGYVGYPTQDLGHSGEPIRVGAYTTESVVECDGETTQGPNVMAHEFGHVLGLPDFYRAVEGIESWQRHWYMGCYSLMAAGSWGCGDDLRVQGFGPSGLDPLSRMILGWARADTVPPVRDQEYVLEPIQTSRRFLLVPLGSSSSREFLLIENRSATGFDDVLPGGGILVYHVDTSRDVYGGAYASDYPVHLVEADGDDALRRTIADGGNRGVAGDIFGNAASPDSLTPLSAPGTQLRTGALSSVWIHSLAMDGDVARIRLTTATALAGSRVLLPRTTEALAPMEVRYAIEGGTPPYEAVPPAAGYPVDGLTLRMDGSDLVLEGVPLVAGVTHRLPMHVRDAAGDAWAVAPAITFEDAALDRATLMDELMAPSAGGADVRTYLDNAGNADGSYDVGDLRAYLLRTGG